MDKFIDESEFELRRILREQMDELRQYKKENVRLRRIIRKIAGKRDPNKIAEKIIAVAYRE